MNALDNVSYFVYVFDEMVAVSIQYYSSLNPNQHIGV